MFIVVSVCPGRQFGCGDGRCIPEHRKCNGNNDCRDKSDESPDLCATTAAPVMTTQGTGSYT